MGAMAHPDPYRTDCAILVAYRDPFPWGKSQCGASRYDTYALLRSMPHIGMSHMGNVPHGERPTWGTSHMGNVSHGECLTWGMSHMGNVSMWEAPDRDRGAVAPMAWAHALGMAQCEKSHSDTSPMAWAVAATWEPFPGDPTPPRKMQGRKNHPDQETLYHE
jgi:hypothetical protein